MSRLKLYTLILLLPVMFCCTRDRHSNINLEQVNTPGAQHIINPGMNSVGIIHKAKLYVWYLTESLVWSLDQTAQFDLPRNNRGLVALGMGTLGVLDKNNTLNFFTLNAELQWQSTPALNFTLPKGTTRISAMRLPYQHGALALHDNNNIIRFYYLDEHRRWQLDETATFVLPEGITQYVMMGSMEIAVIDNNKLGIYVLNAHGRWSFQDDMVLQLPEETLAVLSYEPGTLAVYDGKVLQFVEPDYNQRHWILDDTMNFELPQME
jgi:hypothetical protein